MAGVVKILGWGGQSYVERCLGWNRGTVRKGLREGVEGAYDDRFRERGRKKVEEHLPDLLEDLRLIVDSTGQTDPTFQSTRIYTPLTAVQIRQRLHQEYGYSNQELPAVRTLRNKLNDIGCRLRKVRKCKPLKKIPETDQIFNEVHRLNDAADQDAGILRISLDTKATVKIGNFARGGYSRQNQAAYDHDFQADATLTPFGILLPQYGKSHLWFSPGKVTADFMADRLAEMIPRWKAQLDIHTLTINADNGPECSGRRTQWLKRLVELSDAHGITIQLAYYPPYHSKYNPVERLWGILEKHWRGEILQTVEKALGLARSMTYRGIKPSVRKVTKTYRNGVSVTKKAMRKIEQRLNRMAGLESWFINIKPLEKIG